MPGIGLLSALAGRTVLIIGDVMLDHFVIGRVDRISPEAPVPVVQFDHDEYRLGGAANVAHNIASLGGVPRLVGVVGADEDAERLRAELARRSIDPTGIVADPGRPTTRKVRVVTSRNQQVARIDYERDGEVSGAAEAAIVKRINDLVRAAGAVLVSDYLKGVVSRSVAGAAVAAARGAGVPLLVDPKVPHVDYYRGATLITPNHHEAEAVTHMRIRSEDEARAAARRFRDRAGCEHVLITRGEHGMWLLGGDVEQSLRGRHRHWHHGAGPRRGRHADRCGEARQSRGRRRGRKIRTGHGYCRRTDAVR